jgi:hypothetical protein
MARKKTIVAAEAVETFNSMGADYTSVSGDIVIIGGRQYDVIGHNAEKGYLCRSGFDHVILHQSAYQGYVLRKTSEPAPSTPEAAEVDTPSELEGE